MKNEIKDEKRSDTEAMIWKRIKAVASARDVSMASLSASLGKSANYMNQMSYEAKKMPCGLLVEIAKVLGVSADYLFSGNTDSFNDSNTLRKMISFVALDEDFLTKAELRAIYATMLGMLEKHYDSEAMLEKIKKAEVECLIGTDAWTGDIDESKYMSGTKTWHFDGDGKETDK